MKRPSIHVALVRPLVAALTADPSSLRAFFAATDLTPQLLADAEARISPAQFCVAWAEAIRLSGDRALALTVADAIPPGAFGIVEYVCRSAPTLRDALRQWVRFLGILDDAVAVGMVEADGRAGLRVLAESEAPVPASHELCFAVVLARARALLGDGLRGAVTRFSHRSEAASLPRYRSCFGPDVAFGADHTELLFDEAQLDAPLHTADENLLAILLPTAEERRARTPSHAPFVAEVRRAMGHAFCDDEAELSTVARRLGLTPRSLQRRLKDEGTAFAALRDEVRRELAERYLGEKLSFAEISFLLGFSEPSAFFRAFKRWTGQTPQRMRMSLQAAG